MSSYERKEARCMMATRFRDSLMPQLTAKRWLRRDRRSRRGDGPCTREEIRIGRQGGEGDSAPPPSKRVLEASRPSPRGITSLRAAFGPNEACWTLSGGGGERPSLDSA